MTAFRYAAIELRRGLKKTEENQHALEHVQRALEGKKAVGEDHVAETVRYVVELAGPPDGSATHWLDFPKGHFIGKHPRMPDMQRQLRGVANVNQRLRAQIEVLEATLETLKIIHGDLPE